MVEVSGHVSDEGGVDDLRSVVVFAQTEHVAAEVELLLPDVSHGLGYYFSNILDHHSVFFGEASNEESQSVYFGGRYVHVVGGLFHY